MFKEGLCQHGDLRPVPQRIGASNIVYIWSNETEETKLVLILRCLRVFWSTLLGFAAFQEQPSAALQE